MSSDNIIYALIGYKTIPLVDYTKFNGSFQKTCIKYLESIQLNETGYFELDVYKIIYINDNNISYLIMTKSDYPMSSASSCLKSIKTEFESSFPNKDFENTKKFGLKEEFKEKLRLKLEFHNENIRENGSSEDIDETFHVNEDIVKISDIDSESSISSLTKSKSRLEISNNEILNNIQETNKMCNKKLKAIIIIILVLIVLLIVYIAISLSCNSWEFHC